MIRKEIAKFFSGVAANQVLTHGALAASGVQFTVFGISYTMTLNLTETAAWAIILAFLTYYGWIRR